ncbi:MAG: hypothetical protein IPJ34_36505 [Myxococcales bacterium]|nr:hypothetical protein [Myxococcales bacterium]
MGGAAHRGEPEVVDRAEPERERAGGIGEHGDQRAHLRAGQRRSGDEHAILGGEGDGGGIARARGDERRADGQRGARAKRGREGLGADHAHDAHAEPIVTRELDARGLRHGGQRLLGRRQVAQRTRRAIETRGRDAHRRVLDGTRAIGLERLLQRR